MREPIGVEPEQPPPAPAETIRVLMLAQPRDAVRWSGALLRLGIPNCYERVQTPSRLRAALKEKWDILIAAEDLPGFGALAALRLLGESDCSLPVVVVGQTASDEKAVAALRAGAHDYVAQASPEHLALVVRREVLAVRAPVEAARVLRESQEKSRALVAGHEAAAEELERSNDELRVANAELDFAAEQLRVLNEEITRVNDEMQARAAELDAAQAKLEAVVQQMPSGLLIADAASGDFIQANSQAETILGRRVAPGSSALVHRRWHGKKGDGTRYLPEEWPIARALRGETVSAEEATIERPNGSHVNVSISACPVRDAASRIVAAVAVLEDITERRRAEERQREDDEKLRALVESERQARQDAQDAARAKDQFVATVSHELRNPLNAITAGLHLLRQHLPHDSDRINRTLEVVERNAALQARLVNDLLDLSRIARGKLALQRAPTRLGTVVAAACEAHETEAREMGLTLTCDAQEDLWVLGDFDRLQQAINNLISNSLKFTPPPGSVRVEAAEGGADPPTARIVVSDTGIGISPELAPELFSMFRQGDVAGARSAGLGLGLALVKSLTEMHGGRVWVESEGIGRGSRFIIELPRVETPPQRLSRRERPAKPDRQARVLVVEDNRDTRTLVAEGLTLAGYQVETAGSGEEALSLLADTREHERSLPDFMLVDIGLPGIDGHEFLRRARKLPGLSDVPAFAVTGFGTGEDVARGREAGFAGHFVKPVDVGALNHRIREWLGAGRPS